MSQEVSDLEFLKARSETRTFVSIEIGGRKFRVRSLTAEERINISSKFTSIKEEDLTEAEIEAQKLSDQKLRTALYAIHSLCPEKGDSPILKEDQSTISMVLRWPGKDLDEVDAAIMTLSFRKVEKTEKN